jgi:hypothetical protein
MPALKMADAIAPDGSEIYFLVGDARQASLVEMRLPAGRTSKPVRHRSVEEICTSCPAGAASGGGRRGASR